MATEKSRPSQRFASGPIEREDGSCPCRQLGGGQIGPMDSEAAGARFQIAGGRPSVNGPMNLGRLFGDDAQPVCLFASAPADEQTSTSPSCRPSFPWHNAGKPARCGRNKHGRGCCARAICIPRAPSTRAWPSRSGRRTLGFVPASPVASQSCSGSIPPGLRISPGP